MPRKTKAASVSKLFVLDTSVILYDHRSLLNFKEHDVAVPIQVLEELDTFKSGNETTNLEARSFIRLMEQISERHLLSDWLQLSEPASGRFKVIMDAATSENAIDIFGSDKVDHHILNAALALRGEFPEKRVVLVSKDICLRLKAKSLNLYAEDYETGKIKNVSALYPGISLLDKAGDFPELQEGQSVHFDFGGAGLESPTGNHFFVLPGRRRSDKFFYLKEADKLQAVADAMVFNISPRNAEQACAMHALMNDSIRLVTLQGNAGTGKTLIALACALEQRRNYRQIFITRPIVPLSNKEIGFLPGDAKSKLDPYMAPIWDNLKFIKEQSASDPKLQEKIDELVLTEKIAIAPLAFIRGRTLTKIFFIVDEAQNLTPHEIKTIISRAGEGTKIVFTGDIYQIDTPYLDAESNGLSYLIDRAKDHPLYAHITLQKGERSELANLANELL